MTHQRIPRRRAELACAISLLGLCFVGYVKGSPLLNWLPFDATLLFACCCVASWVGFTLRTGLIFLPAMRPSVLLWLALVPGAVASVIYGYDLTKSLSIFTTTLLCVLIPAIVAETERSRKVWLSGFVGIGLLMLVGIAAFPDKLILHYLGRLTIQGGNSIDTSRALGGAAILLITFAISLPRRRILLALGAALFIAGMFAVGSRGPVVSIMIAAISILFTARITRRIRTMALLLITAISIAVGFSLASAGSGGPERILLFLSGDTGDTVREDLYSSTITQVLTTPFGIGWSGFTQVSAVHGAAYTATYAHNILLEVFIEGGWLPGIALVVYAVTCLVRLRRASSTSLGLAFYGLALYWLAAAQFSGDLNGNRVTWAVLAFGFSVGVSKTCKPSGPSEPFDSPDLGSIKRSGLAEAGHYPRKFPSIGRSR